MNNEIHNKLQITNTSLVEKEIEDLIFSDNKGVLPEDTCIYAELNQFNLLPIEFSIDNNKSIHIKDNKNLVDRDIYLGSNKQFIYERYDIQANSPYITLSYKFRSAWNKDKYLLFKNGYLVNNGLVFPVLPSFTYKSNEKYKKIYCASTFKKGDRVDLFYIESNEDLNKIPYNRDVYMVTRVVTANKENQLLIKVPYPYESYPRGQKQFFVTDKNGYYLDNRKDYSISNDGEYISMVRKDIIIDIGDKLVFTFPYVRNEWELDEEYDKNNLASNSGYNYFFSYSNGGGISKEFYSTIQIIKILFNQDIFTATLKTVKESYIITIQNDYPDKQTIICTYNGKEYTNGSFTAKYGTTITAKLKPYVYPKGSLGYGCDWSVANLNKESYTVIDDFTFTASEPLLSIDNFCYNIPNYKTTETLSDDQLTWLSNKKIGKINGLFGDKDTVTGHEAMPKLKTIPKLGLDTSYCIEFTHLIYACVSLISFDCSWIKTDNAISFFHMFCTYNTPLETLDCSGWNTSKVTNMQDCFANLSMTKIINITGWDTSNVVNMQTAFAVGRNVLGINNVKLEKIIGVIDMKSCTKYYRMFYSAPKLKGVKIKNPPFDPQNANAKKKFEMVAGIEANQYVIVD